MMTRIFFAAFALLVMSATIGSAAFARTQPVHNIENMPAFTTGGKPATVEQIKAAIWAGATSKGWQVREVGERHLAAQIFVRSHMAEVDITYDENGYSITYKDSTNLLYDGAVIHRNYNKWIIFMTDRINAALRKY